MSAAEVWSGRGPARALRAAVSERVAKLEGNGPLTLHMILVGDDPSARGYARAVQRGCKRVGVQAIMDELPGDSSTDEVVDRVQALNADAGVHGILLGFPLAGQVDDAAIVDAIDPAKDVDRLTTAAVGELFGGHSSVGPATAAAVIELLDYYEESIEGRRVVVVGRSNVVGKPLWAMLLARNATTTVCHSRTVDLPAVTSRAEILVAATGSPGLIGAEHVGAGAVVVDVGTTYQNGKVLGDVDFDAVAPRARAVTPVPGGIGPITNYCLMRNLVELVERRSHSPENS
ncbi:MAG: bifunctional methylenetetrahydrofolate dehydrogenase/methenyltetrahydrofolate cyclohydrolase [Chloroflexota bacterium]|nr:bifunctional methylenetetrahydrofolate dehydrogenase/methenyltetrahydrofolate cyclohydrolase [Chloroflexota bacterium]